jgi:small-conductance mechanosensitive channel
MSEHWSYRTIIDAWRAVALALLLSVGPAVASSPESTEPDPANIEAITERRRDVGLEIQTLEAELRERSGDASASELLEKRLGLLATVAATLDRALEELRTEHHSPVLRAKISPDEVSISLLSDLYLEQSSTSRLIESLQRAEEAARQELRSAEERFRDIEAERRRLQEEDTKDADALEFARLRSRLAREVKVLRTVELRGQVSALADIEERIAGREEAIALLRDSIRASSDVSEDEYDALIQKRAELVRRRDAAEREASSLQLRLDDALVRKQVAPNQALLDSIETLRVLRESRAQVAAVLSRQIERVDRRQLLLERWGAVLRGTIPRAELREWADEAEADQRGLRTQALLKPGRIAEAEERREAIQREVLAPDVTPPREKELRRRSAALSELIALQTADSRDLAEQSDLTHHFLEDIRESSGELALGERAAELAELTLRLWRYEIASVEDAPITVGKTVVAFVLLTFGFVVSRRISVVIQGFAERRLQLAPGVSGALRTSSFYLLVVAFTLIALNLLRFPLTAFTLAGGALAIGIGFGSQNVMNNFISGLILMLERPVRAHDLVEVDGNHGTIEEIGARSTRIRATDGRHLIVPNSFFLENNVVNWTLSDDLMRAKVDVGVVYGSPTELTGQLFEQAITENRRVLSEPKPIIIFSEFGDSALIFVAYFWLRARRPMEIRRVESEIRYRTDALFREHGLVIAFPQRDVHLDSASPIEVRMVSDSNAASEDV